MATRATSAFELVRTTAVPRDAERCRPLAQQFEPSSARFAYGLIWLVVMTPFSAVPGLLLLLLATFAMRWLHHSNEAPSDALFGAFLVAWAAAFIYSWIYFARWMRRRRADILALFRDGELLDAEPTGTTSFGTRSGAQLRVFFTFFDRDNEPHTFFANFSRHAGWPNDRKVPVLFRAGSRLCAVFLGADGGFIPRRLRR